MNNVAVKIREVNSEVLVFIERNMPDELSALREAIRILTREVIYHESHPSSSFPR